MAGQIINRGDRTWLVRVFLGRDEYGKRVYANRTVHGAKKQAESVLAELLSSRHLGPVVRKAEKLTTDALLDALVSDYRINGKSVDWCEMVVRCHLKPFFGKMAAVKISTATARDYILHRQGKKAANGTINREISLLRRAFNLAVEDGRLSKAPKFPRLEENNVRKGYLEDGQYRALFAVLPAYLQPLLAFAYYTGCRRGEILALQWSQVDLIERVVRLEPGTTKNSEARIIPLVPELAAILEQQRSRRDSQFPNCSSVFFGETGQRIRSFKNAWAKAVAAAGLGGDSAALFHDLRRTGVRNLVRAGVPEAVAMRISGHKTRAVFDRYNITSEADLHDAARRLGDYIENRRLKEEHQSVADHKRSGTHAKKNQHTIGTH